MRVDSQSRFVCFLAVVQIFTLWHTRKKSYREISISRVGQSAGTAGIQVTAGFFSVGHLGLLVWSLTGQLCACLYLIRKYKTNDHQQLVSKGAFELGKVAREFRQEPASLSGNIAARALRSSAPLVAPRALWRTPNSPADVIVGRVFLSALHAL